MGRVTWTEKAVRHLEAIHEYIAKDSPSYAKRFILSVIKATEKLEMLPYCGRTVPEFRGSRYEFREIIFQNYRIVYRVVENNAEILGIIHAARDMGRDKFR